MPSVLTSKVLDIKGTRGIGGSEDTGYTGTATASVDDIRKEIGETHKKPKARTPHSAIFLRISIWTFQSKKMGEMAKITS